MGVKILGKVCGVLLLVMCGCDLFCASARRTVSVEQQVDKFKQRAKFGQVLERSVYNNNIRLHDLRKILEMRGLIKPLVNDEDEIVHTTKVPLSRRTRPKRDAKGGEKKKKEKGGIGSAIWKRISRGIENFKKHIRQTKKNLVRIIKGPTYPKPKGHGLTKGKGKAASTSSSSKTKVTSRESTSSDEDTR